MAIKNKKPIKRNAARSNHPHGAIGTFHGDNRKLTAEDWDMIDDREQMAIVIGVECQRGLAGD